LPQRIVINQVPIEWSEAGDRLTFFGIDAVIFWKDPSLLSILKPLREELGEDLFHLLVAYEASKGTYEDYHQMVESLGDSFPEGFRNWGQAVSGAGWGRFDLQALDWERSSARVRIDRPWELALFRPAEPDNGVPFLSGKLSGIFSWAFDTHCRARVTEIGDTADGPYAVLDIAPSTATLADELERLQEKRGLSAEAYLQAANRHLRENLERFVEVLEATGEFIWETDRQFRLTYFTDNLARVLGRTTDSLHGEDLRALLTAEGRRTLVAALSGEGQLQPRQELEVSAGTAEGGHRWLALGATPTYDLHGGVNGFRGAGRDITEQKAAEAELERHRERLEQEVAERTAELERLNHHNRLLLESIGEGVFGVDTSGRFTFINPAGADMLGYDPDDLIGRDSHALTHYRHLDGSPYPQQDCAVSAVLADGQARRRTEEPFYRRDGTAFLVEFYVAPILEEGEISGAVVSFRDIRDRKEAEQALAARAYYDDLTGLPNRPHLIEHTEQVLEERARDGGRTALLVLNLDRFKDINDSLGHASGDWLLQRVAARLFHRTRPGEKLARLGGDEFACLVEGIGAAEEAAEVARRLLEGFTDPVTVGYHTMEVGASAGISVYPDNGDSAEILFQNADAALHQAKEKGRGHYQFYTEAMTRAAAQRVQVEAALREAIDREEVVVYYQPQVDVASGRVVGAEALARWHHAQWGWVSPAEFVPVAEQTGLIHGLGRRVLRHVCRQAAQWHGQGLRRLGVNVSPAQLEWEDLETVLGELLSEQGVPPRTLEVEVTEEAFLRDPERASQVLHRLRDMGLCIAIDDFGTGYSSLAYLKALPVDRLKIDRSFVSGVPDDPQDTAITRAVAALGRSLDLEVIAEGVETEAQAEFLQREGVQEAQGFLYGAAVPAEEWSVRFGQE
jgi:diguanylate cyclase (GGDEF)-like protein/PAS domain S-box-containing protein